MQWHVSGGIQGGLQHVIAVTFAIGLTPSSEIRPPYMLQSRDSVKCVLNRVKVG
jgi:hypothetical protein